MIPNPNVGESEQARESGFHVNDPRDSRNFDARDVDPRTINTDPNANNPRNLDTRVDVRSHDPNAETDPNTGLPRTVSLGAVLARIRLAPHEIATMLSSWGAQHAGTAQEGIGPKLADAARAVLNPVSYGAKPPPPATPAAPVADPSATPAFENLHESR